MHVAGNAVRSRGKWVLRDEDSAAISHHAFAAWS